MGDFIDLDICAVWEAELVPSPTEEVSVHVAGNSRQVKAVLDRDSIRWQNIDGPQSLMIAWKKSIATSSHFRQESIGFLRRRSQSSLPPRWNAMAHPDSEDDDLAEDLEEDGIAFDQTTVHNVEWTDSDDVNLDAAHLDTFLHVVGDSKEREL